MKKLWAIWSIITACLRVDEKTDVPVPSSRWPLVAVKEVVSPHSPLPAAPAPPSAYSGLWIPLCSLCTLSLILHLRTQLTHPLSIKQLPFEPQREPWENPQLLEHGKWV